MTAPVYYELPRLLTLMGTIFFVNIETDLGNAASTAVTKDYCEGETFRGRCSYDEVISMDSATYGRMQLDRCVKVNMGYVGCQANVLDIADEKCSGRRSCDVSVPDPEFEERRPCLELKSYLVVSYHCAKVFTPDSNDCRVSRLPISSSSSSHRHPPSPPPPPQLFSGHLASIVALETGCGRSDRPWTIEVSHGQRINLTLVDFTARRPTPSPTDGGPGASGADGAPGASGADGVAAAGCVRYARVVERSADGEREESIDVCGGRQGGGRKRRVYSSRGHVVRVMMNVQRENPNYFLIGYQAIGCPDPVLPQDQYFIRADDEGDLVIGCRHSPDRWRLTCRHDNQWQGEVTVNCTSGSGLSSEVIDSSEKEKSPNGVLVAVLCIMLILLVLLTALITLLLYKRRRRLRRSPFSEEFRQTTTVKEAKEADAENVTYATEEADDVDDDDDDDGGAKTRKDQRYGRHVTRHHHQRHHQRHHVYDSPIVTKNENRERGSEYEKVETCQTIGQYSSSHIWNTPLPKIPGQS